MPVVEVRRNLNVSRKSQRHF